MENQTSNIIHRHRRVILFPLPYQGHINPMLQLANLLYSKGFSITILHTNFNKPKTSNYPHFTFRFIIDNDPLDERYRNLPLHGMGAFSRVVLFNRYGADQLRHQLELELKDEAPVSCLITDALWHFSQSVADSLGLPRVVLRTSSLFCFLVYASIPLLSDRGYLDLSDDNSAPVLDGLGYVDLSDDNRKLVTQFPCTKMLIIDHNFVFAYYDQLFDFVHGFEGLEEKVVDFPVLKVKDIIKMGIKKDNDTVGEVIGNMVKQTKASSGIVWNSFKELEEPEFETVIREIRAPSFLIPFAKHFTASSSSLHEQDRTVFPWLDQQPPNSVVYISFGSVAQVTEKHFLEIAHGLVDSKQSFLWVVRPGFVDGSTWLEPLPDGWECERGRIVKWAPQQEVLAHKAVGAFWTHGGWNSTCESICEGVPMICSPFWGDQPLDARYMSDVWKVGVYLENGWKREEITSAIRRVMVDEEGEEIRERVRVLKQKLDASLIKGGSSYESVESLVAYISLF